MQIVKELQVTPVVCQMREFLSALWTERRRIVVLRSNFYFEVFHMVLLLLWCVMSPNDQAHRRGRPVASEFETDAARPRSVQRPCSAFLFSSESRS